MHIGGPPSQEARDTEVGPDQFGCRVGRVFSCEFEQVS